MTREGSCRPRAGRVALVVVVLSLVLAVVVVHPAGAPLARADGCTRGVLTGAADLNAAFAHAGVGGPQGYAGGDYPHAYPLPDGRVLWLFQDVFWSDDEDVRDSLTAAAHNGGLVQDGTCFTTFGGPGRNAIGNDETTPLRHWFWPLDGELGADGALWIFMAEMRNPNGNGAALGAAPTGTWVARLDPATLDVLSFAPAPDASAQLYGWSVVSDTAWSYLYGYCDRQFIHDVNGPGEFDLTCTPDAYVARVPVGHFDLAPEYWNGAGWTTDAAAARPVLSRSPANPMSVQWFGDAFVAVTKVGEWWGSDIVIDRAPSATGPWEEVQRIPIVADRRCSQCGIYAAIALPWLDAGGRMTVAVANGAPYSLWYRNIWLYRPSFYRVAVPGPATTGASTPAPPVSLPPGTAGFEAVDPVRLVDTRQVGAPFGRLGPGQPAVLDLRGRMPAGTQAVALNLATTGSEDGWVRAYACAGPAPSTSSINPVAGLTVSNAAIVPVGDGRICFESLRGTELVADLDGWLTTGSTVGLEAVDARRLVDTRTGLGGATRLAAGQVVHVQAVAQGSASTAVSLQVTAVDPGDDGYVTAWPCDRPMPVVANLNPHRGVTRPNAVNVRVAADGTVCLFTMSATDLVVDLFGEFRPGAAARYGVVAPARVMDTRAAFAAVHAGDDSRLLALPGIVAAQLNVTAIGGAAGGFVTAYRCMSGPRPVVAAVTYAPGEVSGNATLATVGRGVACFFTYRPADLVVDLFGVWTTAR